VQVAPAPAVTNTSAPVSTDNTSNFNSTTPTSTEAVPWDPLKNPRVQFIFRLPNVTAAAYGASLTADLAAVVADKGRLTSHDWARVLLLVTSPVTANITVSGNLLTAFSA
jgi:hypothetical protein